MIALRSSRTFGERTAPTEAIDPAKIYVIATEGDTEFDYFKAFHNHKDELSIHSSIHVEPIDREDTKSAPKHVIELLEEYVDYYGIKAEELWIVIDRDCQNNSPEQLREIYAKSNDKGFNVGLSTPCFELWLLLHVADISTYNPVTLFENRRVGKSKRSRRFLDKELSNVLGGYNKANLNFDKFIGGIKRAVEQGKTLENDVEALIESFGTNIHILVESILTNQ